MLMTISNFYNKESSSESWSLWKWDSLGHFVLSVGLQQESYPHDLRRALTTSGSGLGVRSAPKFALRSQRALTDSVTPTNPCSIHRTLRAFCINFIFKHCGENLLGRVIWGRRITMSSRPICHTHTVEPVWWNQAILVYGMQSFRPAGQQRETVFWKQ